MSRRGARLVVTAALAAAAGGAALAACFPDFEVGDVGSPDAQGDVTVASDDTGSDAPAMDRTATGDDGPATQGDSSATDGGGADGGGFDGGGFDGQPLANPLIPIEGGTFYFQVTSWDPTADANVVIDASATLDYTLGIDQHEVTLGEFVQFANAGQPPPPPNTQLDPKYPTMVWDSSWTTQNVSWGQPPDAGACNGPTGIGSVLFDSDNTNLPMNCVSWMQALAYCWWKEKARLPTDTEWRVVATSEGRQSIYPWGAQAPDCTNAIFDGPTHWCGFPVPVMSASSQTADKVFDIVGSVSEWLWDVSPQGNDYVYPADAGIDYPGPAAYPSPGRQWIGGAFWQHEDALSPIQPGATFSEPAETFDDQGWRCAKSLP